MAIAAQRERRIRRSDVIDEALGFWLDKLVETRGARAAVVGTTDGLPIASSGEVDPLWLAVVGSDRTNGERDVHSSVIGLDQGDEVILSLCGAAVTEAEVGHHIRRILL